jgi:ferredoxin-NADP reductase
MLSPSVRELVLVRDDDAPLAFEAGQWVSLVLPQVETHESQSDLRRAYSIASPPDGSPRFELAVTHVSNGPGSSYLHTLEPGARLKAIGPQGFFTRPREHAAPSLFVATGTGVTPLRSMIKHALATGLTEPLWLLFGVRHEADILYREELADLAAKHPHLRVEITLSKPPPGWTGRTGYVQAHARDLWLELSRLGTPPHAYVCGLERMIKSMRELLRKDLGVPRDRVHTERYD